MLPAVIAISLGAALGALLRFGLRVVFKATLIESLAIRASSLQAVCGLANSH